jgi:deazaflavin-dependent oxidoreductase (nitroreductase family)
MSPRLGRRIAHFNRRVTNRITRPLAPWLPGFGLVVHVGRRSQREYRTPVNVFHDRGGYVIALTYGQDADWVKNVLAAGRCTLITRDRQLELTAPRILHDEGRGGGGRGGGAPGGGRGVGRTASPGCRRFPVLRGQRSQPFGCSVMRSTVRIPTRS